MTKRTVSATEARVHFGELLDSVAMRNDIVFVERAGEALVVVVSLAEWQRHSGAENDRWAGVADMMEEHWAYLSDKYGDGLTDFDVEEDLRAAREERDEQLVGDLHRR